ncbi:hypothetical protein ABTW51_09230 [Serratia nematodiphila]
MTTIKRFTPDYKMHAVRFEAFAREAEHGELVRFDAHQQTVSALEAERDAQQKRADALAVENAALKASHPQPFGREMMKALDAYEKYQDEVPETGMLDAFFILRDSIRVETPATDAALAAIQAQGVEKFAKELRVKGDDAFFDAIAEAQANAADEFAAKLREAK